MTPAGHRRHSEEPLSKEQTTALANVINEAFELLRLNYQHLYFSAYPEVDAVNSAKRLWLESLSQFSPEAILQATHALIKQSDYLPTISRMIKQCTELSTRSTLPDTYSAYCEACNAPSPKQNYNWSHPAIYHAGKQSNWHFIHSNDEAIAFPIFKNHYEALCQRIAQGDTLPPIQPLSLPESTEHTLSKSENAERMANLRNEVSL